MHFRAMRLRHGLGISTLASSFVVLVLVSGVNSQQTDGASNTYIAAFQDVSCKSDAVAYPTSTKEVADQVKTHIKAAAAAGVGLKVRASHRAFHSTASFPCPGRIYSIYPHGSGEHPLLATQIEPSNNYNDTTVTLLLDNMTQVLSVDPEKYQLRVQSGMMVTKLLQEAAKVNMSIPLGSVPAFADLTLGGVLVTGAHGSGHLSTSSLGDILEELTWVDGKGNVHVSARNSTAGKALVAGLGVGGLVTEMLLQLQPPSHTELNTRYKQSDVSLLADVKALLKESPHVLVVWRPDLKQYTAHVTKQVDTSVPRTGGMIPLDLPKIAAQALGASLAAWQADVQDKFPLTAIPIMAAIQETSVGHAAANQFNGQRMFKGVGDTNEMQATSCGKKCLWNMGSKIAMDDIHMSIELEQLGEWIEDVKQLMVGDLWAYGMKKRRVLSPGYFWLRFGHGSDDFLSHTSNMTAPVHVQMSFMKSMHNPLQPNKFGWVLEVLEQLTLCKYKGKPHWGKNHQRTFLHPTCHIKDHLPLWDKMMAFRAGSDPQKVYEPQLFADMAAGVPNRYSPGCTLRGECYCTEDIHCAPGFLCLPSAAFPEYKACRVLPY